MGGSSLIGGFGLSGAGITGQNLSVINSGQIGSTMGGAAILFSGGTNRLELQAGYSFVGNVLGAGSDTLALGGGNDATFDVSGLGTQYMSFSAFEKTGNSTWTLTGAPAQSVTPWTLKGGTLSIDADAELGDVSSTLTFDGGTLQVTGTTFTSTARNIVWGADGGGFDIVDPANAFTVAQDLDGSGSLTKSGACILVLGGANSYQGGTTVEAGTLSISSDANLGDAAGGLTLDGGTLSTTASFGNGRAVVVEAESNIDVADATTLGLSGTISGDGSLDKRGSGSLVLTGANNFTGGTTISDGTLQLGTRGATGTIAGAIENASVLQIFNANTSAITGIDNDAERRAFFPETRQATSPSPTGTATRQTFSTIVQREGHDRQPGRRHHIL